MDDARGADFGDARLNRRLVRLTEALSTDPAASFPVAMGTDAALEAAYRFLQNKAVSPEGILAPHVAATVRRVLDVATVIVTHDTTDFAFSGERRGLGRINEEGQGFFGHFSLAMRSDGSRYPLGLLGLRTFVRQEKPRGHHRSNEVPLEQRESFRWHQAVQAAEAAVGTPGRLLHVMDSEADAFELLSELVGQQRRFVVRLKYDRVVEDPKADTHLHQKLAGLTGRLMREVQLASRSRKQAPKGSRNRARGPRLAVLDFAATPVTFRAPAYLKGHRQLSVHVVHVREVAPPPDAEPVDWKLVTTEPIESTADLETIVDAYRARWLIEEYFKALKTGCAIAKRQLETFDVLVNALAVLAPIACELLLLRAMTRDSPDIPAASALGTTKLLILHRHPVSRLKPHASLREAFLAIAQLGGHIKNNGEPGWQVIGRGYEKLLALEEGAILATITSDQS